jgi:hypothetical protein
MKRTFLLAAFAISLPAFAQTTTTVTSQPQQQPPPPPPSTTVTTQTSPPPPSTQVVVNPNDPNTPPPPRTRVRVEDNSSVTTVPSGRSSAAIVATDALYGGIAGALVGGGVTLIDQGNHWQRDVMVGAGVGVLVGAAFGIYEATTQPTTVVTHAAADRNPAASDTGIHFAALSRHF